ncbi:MAG: FHA domain-containing protein [Eubacteriales bacterium]
MSMDALDMLSGTSEMSSMISSIMGGFSTFIIIAVAGIACWWALSGYKWLMIGKKAGLDTDWMPFVPFAKTIYRLKILREEWWKMFIFEGWIWYSFLLKWIILAISAYKWTTFSTIVGNIYLLACVAYNVYWRYKYYKAFDIKPYLAIGIINPLEMCFRCVIDYQIAFTNNFAYEKKVNVGNGAGSGTAGKKAAGASKTGVVEGLSGMYAGQQIPLASGDELLIGRDNAMCNLIVDQHAEKVSRKHCGITYDASRGVYIVTDYSSNGTYIDGGNRLAANVPTRMQRGTVLALGNRENRFRLV